MQENNGSGHEGMPGWVKWTFIGSIAATAGLGGLTFVLFHMFMA